MTTSEEVPDRRADTRLDMALQITLLGHKGETKNISATGVYFEVITDDTDAFFPGRTIPVMINASSIIPGFRTKDIQLKGNGAIVRNDIKGVTSNGDRLGVAMKFKERLDLKMD
ncbi:MAG: hypothetical protein ACUZ8I_01245 [Candidatus Scalindua sp.]